MLRHGWAARLLILSGEGSSPFRGTNGENDETILVDIPVGRLEVSQFNHYNPSNL
jgi:hypothetical protein